MAHKFSNSITHMAGTDPSLTQQAKIVNVNILNWTVDVVTVFDQKRYFDIQVGAPYLHFNAGEGIYVVPEVGALCYVMIPGDSSPMFVMAFVAPLEVRDDTSSADAPVGTRSRGGPVPNNTDASMAAGRRPFNPGDIVLRGRDGNQIVLHRGGVLQIGATEVAQRLYIPLGNHIVDFSQNYTHHNMAGTMMWSVDDGASMDETPAQFLQTFRLYAQNKNADIKVAVGKVYKPMDEPDDDAHQIDREGIVQYSIGTEEDGPLVYELVLTQEEIAAESGDPSAEDTKNRVKLRFMFDRKGNLYARVEGNVFLTCHQKLRIRSYDEMILEGDKSLTLNFKEGVDITGANTLALNGKVVTVQKGSQPVARLGDSTLTPFPPGFTFSGVATLTFPSTPVPGTPIAAPVVCVIAVAPPLSGAVASGNNGFLA